jgi:hypothetical protein
MAQMQGTILSASLLPKQTGKDETTYAITMQIRIENNQYKKRID